MRIFYVIANGLITLLCLNAFCLVYYNIPVHITSKAGTTDYVWEKHAYYSKMTEGFGYGRTNNEGFNNLEDYKGQPVDILLMGSSQMEGTNIPQNKTTIALLNRYFKNAKYGYNIGISGHGIPQIVNNLETAVRYYKPKEYVIIEIGSVQSGIQALINSITSNLKRIPSFDSNIMFFLQKIPYLRLLYFQYKQFTKQNDEDGAEQSIVISDREQYTAVLDEVMKRLSQIGMEHDIKILIFYHPHLTLNYDSSVSEKTDYEYLTMFENSCRDNNIIFVNMADIFIEAYNNNHTLPHGFLNTAVGVGHLNQTGHRLIAGELFRQIHNREKEGSL